MNPRLPRGNPAPGGAAFFAAAGAVEMEVSRSQAWRIQRNPLTPRPLLRSRPVMLDRKCAKCGGTLEEGFISTSNGSGLFWSHTDQSTRLRPRGMEVLAPT